MGTSTEPGLFSSNTPAANISVFGVTEAQHNGIPGWASHGWGGRASPAVSTQWNTPTTTQVASTPPIWTPQWGTTDANNSNTGWPDSNQKQLGAPASSHSTNPFGTSLSTATQDGLTAIRSSLVPLLARIQPTRLEPRH